MYILFLGNKGWIGSQFASYLESKEITLITLEGIRYENYQILFDTIKLVSEEYGIDKVVCMIGRTSGQAPTKRDTDSSTIDFLEFPENHYSNLRDNFIAPTTIATICNQLNLHLTYLGTGCIYKYPDVNSPLIYTEDDEPNFTGSQYSRIKGLTDKYMRNQPNVLNVRIRMPITNKDEPKNFISKIIKYNNISSCDNSMTVLHDVFPALYDMIMNKKCGTVHLVNPGITNHKQILEMYKVLCNPDHKYNLVTDKDLDLKSQRSRCLLSHNLHKFTDVVVPNINSSIIKILEQWK